MPRLTLREQPSNEIKPGWPLHKKIRIWMYHTVVPWVVYFFVSLLTSTYRWRQMVSKELLDLMSSGKPFAVVVWHGDMLLSQSLGKRLGWNNRTAIMVALNQSGEVETRILDMLGYYVVRGSAKKRGKEALADMKDILNQGAIAAMVVDGPSGPAREVKAGVVELARYCRVPVVPVAFIRGNEWTLPTWDRTRIPKPFSRCITTSTKPIYVPYTTSDSRFEAIRADIKDTMIELEERKIGWDQAMRVEMKLLSVFEIRNLIAGIRKATAGLTEEEFVKDSKTHSPVHDKLKLIAGELGRIRKRHYRDVYPEMDWKPIRLTKRALRHLNYGDDPRKVWAVVKEDMPDLSKRIDDIIEKLPLHLFDTVHASGEHLNSRMKRPNSRE
jgi:lysophospholipid acyltransferase (LPLAT)-like uncharacterized protein/uncharacterized protein with HEPN domain